LFLHHDFSGRSVVSQLLLSVFSIPPCCLRFPPFPPSQLTPARLGPFPPKINFVRTHTIPFPQQQTEVHRRQLRSLLYPASLLFFRFRFSARSDSRTVRPRLARQRAEDGFGQFLNARPCRRTLFLRLERCPLIKSWAPRRRWIGICVRWRGECPSFPC